MFPCALKLNNNFTLTDFTGNVFFLLYVVGGLVMTVTAGGQCVDLAVKTVQDPANLLRLSNTLIRLMGLRYQMHAVRNLQLKWFHFKCKAENVLSKCLYLNRKKKSNMHICL